MRWKYCVAAALSATFFLGASVHAQRDERLDFAYEVSGNVRIKPLRVFNDGKNTFIQPDASQLAGARVLDLQYSRQGDYLLVPGLHSVLRIEYRGAVAIARRIATSSVIDELTVDTLTMENLIADAKRIAKTNCAQASRIEVQEYDVQFVPQRALPQKSFQKKLKRILAAAKQAEVITIVSAPEGEDRTLAEERARYLREALGTRGINANVIQLDTQFRATPGSQIVIQRKVESCGDGGDSDTTALVQSESVSAARASSTVATVELDHEAHAALKSDPTQAATLTRTALEVPHQTRASMESGATQAATLTRTAMQVPAREVASQAVSEKPTARDRYLTFAPNSSVRESLRRYLREEGIDLVWQVPGDLIVEEYANVSGANVKAVIATALRRLGLKGTLIAERRLIVESAS